mgnify:CR=1 FL=1
MISKTKESLVCIVIVNWNGEKIIFNCLNSLKKTYYKNLKVVVIDNGSSDGSLEIIKKFKKFELITLEKNIGYAPAINLGWNYCLKKHSPKYICNVNNDIIIVQKGWLSSMVDELEKEKSRGICSNKTISKEGLLETQTFDKKRKNVLEKDKGQYDFVEEVETVGGTIFMVKRNVIDKIGGLDENFFFGPDDIDYCLRAKQAGFKIIYDGFSKAIHLGSFSYKASDKDDIYKYQSYGKLLCSFRYDNFLGKMKMIFAQFTRIFVTKKDSLNGDSFSNLFFHKRFPIRSFIFLDSFFGATRNYKKIKQDYFLGEINGEN